MTNILMNNNIIEFKTEVKECVDAFIKWKDGSNNFFCYNIYGDGGLGKTTLSKQILEQLPKEINKEKDIVSAVRIDSSECYNYAQMMNDLYDDEINVLIKKLLDVDSVEEVFQKCLGFISTKAGATAQIVSVLMKEHKNRLVRDSLRELVECANSIMDVENMLVRLFQDGIHEGIKHDSIKLVIIIDNFAYTSSTDINRNISMLKKLIEGVSAFWIIVGRNELNINFAGKGGNFKTKQFWGFNEIDAKKYIENALKNLNPKIGEEDKQKLINWLLEKCNAISRISDITKKDKQKTDYYFPYKLVLFMEYYKQLDEDKKKFENLDKFFPKNVLLTGYLYQELPDYLIHAFQILSCVNVWTQETFNEINQKFHIYIFAALNVLKTRSCIEVLSNGNFKLHDAVRDDLYENDQNYIKRDIQKLFYEKFCDGNDEIKKEINRVENLDTHVTLSLDYVEFGETDDSFIYKLEKFINSLEYYYKKNNSSGNVTYEFIYTYAKVEKRLGEWIKKIEGNNTKELNILKDWYYTVKKKLADLYTNINNVMEALKAENQYCIDAEEWVNKTKEQLSENDADTYIMYYKARNHLGTARNSYIYDFNHDWIKWGNNFLDPAKNTNLWQSSRNAEKDQIKLYQDVLKKIGCEDELLINIFDDKVFIDSEEFKASVEEAYEYAEVVRAFRNNIFNPRIITNDNNHEFITLLRDNIIDTLMKLRGNIPWYHIRGRQYNIIQNDDFDEISYGIKTYLIRKALNEARQAESDSAKEIKYDSLTLRSYKNIGIYLLKNEKNISGMILSEALNRYISLIDSNIKLNDIQRYRKNRIESISLQEKDGFDNEMKMLYNARVFDTSELKYNYSTDMLDTIQYMGDYYMHEYAEYKENLYLQYALKQFRTAFLIRYVKYGMNNPGTLDSYFYLSCAMYYNDNNICKEMLTYYKDCINNGRVYVPKGKEEHREDIMRKISETTEFSWSLLM